MNLINKIVILLLLSGVFTPSIAAVSDIDMTSCSIFSEGDKKEGKEEKEGEEEPDCE